MSKPEEVLDHIKEVASSAPKDKKVVELFVIYNAIEDDWNLKKLLIYLLKKGYLPDVSVSSGATVTRINIPNLVANGVQVKVTCTTFTCIHGRKQHQFENIEEYKDVLRLQGALSELTPYHTS